jgi:hypothetical protein
VRTRSDEINDLLARSTQPILGHRVMAASALDASLRYAFRGSVQGFRVGGRSYGAWRPVMSLVG